MIFIRQYSTNLRTRSSFLIYSIYLVQASFFIAYVVTTGWTTIASELFQLTTLLYNFIKRIFCRNGDDDFEPPSIPYHSEIPRIRLFGLLGVTYFILAPLILPFLLIYFCLGYIIFRNQVCKLFYFSYPPEYMSLRLSGTLWLFSLLAIAQYSLRY